jgi:two-component system OmpR family sensor kinase
MTRLPIRLRLTLAFAIAMAAVLAAMGAFVYIRVSDALVSSVDQSLRRQATETAIRLRQGGALAEQDKGEGTGLAQLLDPSGHVVRSTAPAGAAPLTRPPEEARATLKSTRLPGRNDEWRLFAQPIHVEGKPYWLVLGRSLQSRDETLHHLFRGFVIAGPLALLIASLAGYGLAAAALRPVEGMRRRAAAISAQIPGRRLPVPHAVDEISRLAATLNDMLERLEAAFAHEQRFVADASHELRTPLALLRTELELALRRPRSREELETALRSAAEDTERLSRLAEDLLLIARADQGALPLRRERVEPRELLPRVAARLAARMAAHGRELRVNETSTTTALDADPARLEQALGNLVENSLLHGAGTITLSAHSRGTLVELHVLDEGSGFTQEFLPRAFDRFSRGDEARGRGGTGLGLSIVELVARAHGGSAGARNRPSGGADVWIAVPAVGRERGDGHVEPRLTGAPTA